MTLFRGALMRCRSYMIPQVTHQCKCYYRYPREFLEIIHPLEIFLAQIDRGQSFVFLGSRIAL